jgi:hypothetical protein
MWGGKGPATESIDTDDTISKKEMDHINKIKYTLIKYDMAPIFSDDEFQMVMPPEELKHLVLMDSSYKYTAPIKTVSLETILMRNKHNKKEINAKRVKSKLAKSAKTRKTPRTTKTKTNRTRSTRFLATPGLVKV